MAQKYALLSVYDKTGIVEFARKLIELGWTILSSGGTSKKIAEAGLAVKDVAEIIGGKAILGHRVVTLSREIHAGLLATELPEDIAELEALGVPRIDLVCVDMYPLEAEIERSGATFASVVEKTDIGGPTMLRSAAKGGRIVLCDPADRERIIEWLSEGMPGVDLVKGALAAKAEFIVAGYAFTSARYLSKGEYEGFMGVRARTLCYGENRRQRNAAFFTTSVAEGDPLALGNIQLLEGGNAPSFVNMTDLHRLIETATHIGAAWQVNFPKDDVPWMAIGVKHGNACGAALGAPPAEVVKRMIEGDPDAISGGVVLVNFPVDDYIAELLRAYAVPTGAMRVLDSVIAPSFSDGAIDELTRRTGKCRLFALPALSDSGLGKQGIDASPRFRHVRGGFLWQEGDPFILKFPDEWGNVLSFNDAYNLILAWAIGHTANSNTIVLAKDSMLIGSGTGQRSRVMACRVALLYASTYGHDTKGAVAYSDSYFPFTDGIEVLADAGVSTIFATSGSIRDEEVREACVFREVRLLQLPDAEARGFYGH